MHSKSHTVLAYLQSLSDPRREAISTVRDCILAHLPEGYVEVMNWGMIAYEVPLSVYRETYNKKPLMYAALASQKNHMAVYLTCVYGNAEARNAFVEKWIATGKKLDMGASCVRFKKLETLNLHLIAEEVARTNMSDFVAREKAFRAARKNKS